MKSLRVLLAEDEVMISEALAELLVELGHEVCSIEVSEANAIKAAARFRPDLMIVDARLGKGSGVAAVAEILRTRFIPHVIVSGDRAHNWTLSPRTIFLQKPFLAPELIRAMRRALGTQGRAI